MVTRRICFIGDSFTTGARDPECLGWCGRISAAACRAGHDVTVYNLGVRRDTSTDILARWQHEVQARTLSGFDMRMVFSFGTNDTTLQDAGSWRAPIEQSIGNAEHMLTKALSMAPVLMIGPPPIDDADQNERSRRLSDAYAAVCARLGVPYLDVFTTLLGNAVWMEEVAAVDGAHPAAAGYAELARLVEAWPGWQAWFRE